MDGLYEVLGQIGLGVATNGIYDYLNRVYLEQGKLDVEIMGCVCLVRYRHARVTPRGGSIYRHHRESPGL